jgi:hypothetical protein
MDEAGQYGLSFIDVVLITGFAVSVVMAIRTAKNVEDHARWMIATVYWSVFPGLFRLSFLPIAIINGGEIPFRPESVMAALGVLNLAVIGTVMYRDRRIHPAYLSVAVASVIYFIHVQIAGMQWWRTLADALFKL